ncbi:MAG TPA: T9SS type A sorting domain-containing protein [Saprospiraceae bacterium]|nr:T9SS type A sorting domain-containing protein [Saprospiraceae bacterium]HNJ63262.1 T9SS type A sorting domain-containing protein [Saprospiraceae bacterium]
MKKMNFTLRVWSLLCMAFLGWGVANAQCPAPAGPYPTAVTQLPATLVVTAGSYASEVGFQLNGAGILTPINVASNGGGTTTNVTLNPAGGAYNFFGTDTYGDGWNGAAATFTCLCTTFFQNVTLAGAGPTLLASGNIPATGGGCTFTGVQNYTLNAALPACTATLSGVAPITSGCGAVTATICSNSATPATVPGLASGNINGTYPAGLHIITVCVGCSQQSFAVNCTALPTFLSCPTNQTIVLDPGDCDKALAFNICATSCAGFACSTGDLDSGCQTTYRQGGTFFNLRNNSTKTMRITGIEVNLNADGFYPATRPVKVYRRAGAGNTTYVGAPATAAAWGNTPVATATLTAQDVCDTAKQIVPIPAGAMELAPGQTIGVHVEMGALLTTPYLGAKLGNFTYTSAGGELSLIGGALGAFAFQQNFPGYTHDGGATYQLISQEICLNDPMCTTQSITANPGTPAPLPNGKYLLPIGQHNFSYTATDINGNAANCNFSVMVMEYPNAVKDLKCNDLVQVSLDGTGTAIIGADDILEGGPYGCYDEYVVEVYDNGKLIPGSPKVTGAYIDKELTVKVIDPATGNSCWGKIIIECKFPPKFTCSDITVPCGTSLDPCSVFDFSKGYSPANLPVATGAVGPVDIPIEVKGLPLPVNGQPIAGFDLDVALGIDHQWLGLVEATITAPNGISVKLQDNSGPAPFGCNLAGSEDVVFDDSSVGPKLDPTNLDCSGANFQGSHLPIDVLASVNDGSDLNGTWTLNVTISASGIPAGSITKAVLNFKAAGAIPCAPVVEESCCAVNMTYSDKVLYTNSCTNDCYTRIERTWTGVDCRGNKTQCVSYICVLKTSIPDIVPPADLTVACTEAYPGTDVGGFPKGDGCNVQCSYTDLVIPVCQNSYKIVRSWTCVDWCTGTIGKYDQIIKVMDNVGPDFKCPSPDAIIIKSLKKDYKYQGCYAQVLLPWVPMTDNCSTFNNIDVVVSTVDATGKVYSATDPGADSYFKMDLPLGNYVFTYTATDDCGNSSTCTVTKQLKDVIEPVAICEKHHQVSLTDSVTLVTAESFDDGSYDECSNITFLARRLDNPKCQGNDATPFGPTVPFYCCDAKGGQDVTVELRVTDADGNFNICWSTVSVEDKIRPLITCPPDITVWCGQPYTPTEIDTTVVHNDIKSAISEVYAHKYQFPLTVEGFPKGAKIQDVDVTLDMKHGLVRQLEVTLFDPYGNKSTLFTAGQCAGYGQDILATFNDQAYDIAYWNSTYNAQYKAGSKIPANFVCIDSKTPTLGAYNKGTVTGTGETFNIGQMRPGADHLKVFNGYPLNNNVSKAFAEVNANEIDPTTNRMSNFNIFNLLNNLGLTTGDRITLKYESAIGGAINVMETGTFYIFKVVDPFTLELLKENGTDIVSVPAGSVHKFNWASTWVLQVYDTAPLAGGFVNGIDLHFAWGLPTALKPVVTDNAQECGVSVTWTDLDQPDPCYNNVIRRRWLATDAFGNSRNCIQRISFEDETPLVVQFPCDITVNCDKSSPEFNINDWVKANGPIHSGDCESVGIEPIIHELTVVPDACKKYIVKWKVIDWCQFDINNNQLTNGGLPLTYDDLVEWFPNLPWHNQCNYTIPGFPYNVLASEDDGDGYWEHIQYVKVIDKTKPTVECKDTTICSYGACEENVTLVGKASDGCDTAGLHLNYAYKVDLFNDGNYEIVSPANVNSQTFNATVPFGRHRITWTIADGCGNFTTCSYIFWVKDCKKPTPVCHFLSAPTMPVQKVVTIWATDFEAGSSFDNCCAYEDLVFRIVKTGESDHQTPPTATSVTFDCNELGSQPVELWAGDCGYDANGDGTISDDERNWDYCNTTILISDNDNVCGPGGFAAVAGTVETETGKMVSGVNLIAVTGGSNQTTSNNGQFSFTLPTGQSYTIVPEKNVNPLNGVNTLDLVYMTNHILGKKALTSGYKKIAADINKDKKITTGDLVQLRQLILHITNEFPANTSWRFVEKSYSFTTGNEQAENFPEVKVINNLASGVNANFIGVKVGDVTNDANPTNATASSEVRNGGTLTFGVADQNLVAGQEYKVNFTAKDFTNILGYQYTIGYDVDALEFVGLEGKAADISADNFGLTNLERGKITTSWNGKSATTLSADETMFTVTFKATKSGKLSKAINVNSSLTPAVAFNSNEETMDVALEFNSNNGTVAASNFELLQNNPNPFKESTTISFILPAAGKATLSIYTVDGKVVKTIQGDFAQGMNNVVINRSEISAAGVLYYQLDTDTDSAVRKMIIIE